MDMPSASVQFPGVNLERIAIIEMSFPKGSLDKAVAFYQELLGVSTPNTSSPCFLKVTESIGMLLVDSGTATGGGTTVYWRMPTGPKQDLVDAYKQLINNYGCKPTTPPTPPYNLNADMWLARLEDPAGDVFGITINPPVPKRESAAAILEMEFPIEPTHVINPPVTADGQERAE